MTELMRISEGYDLLPAQDFLRADEPGPMFEKEPDALTGTGVRRDLAELDALVEDMLKRHDRPSTKIDLELAVPLHRILSIDRRLGSDRRFWAWLGLVKYPKLVARRWKPAPHSDGSAPVRNSDRYSGGHVRQTFARLWWAVELTVDEGGAYDLSERFLNLSGFQDAYENFFGRAFCQYRPALKAFIEGVGHCPEDDIKNAAKEFGYAMAGRVLEVMSESEIREELALILRDMRIVDKGERASQ